jgi:2-polyprenyl-3-methyl-5-hydroxy-6-metoxy-1,4-benzoquinol methylase
LLKKYMLDPEIRRISAIIMNTPRVYNSNHKAFYPIYKHELIECCDRVFIDRLRTNPISLKMSFWKDHFELKAVAKYPEIKGSILDFGCGSGHSDIYLAREEKTIHGIDLSPIGIAIGNHLRSLESEEVRKRVSFSIADVTIHQPPGELLFDSVWSSHVFEHIMDPKPVLFGLRNWVKRGAYFLISVPLGNAYDDPGHFHHFWDAEQVKKHFETSIDVVKIDVDKNDQVFRILCQFHK